MDSSPNVIIESLAMGTPVIATNTGGIPCIVENGIDSLLVPCGDKNGMANAMKRLLCNPDIAHSMGLAGRERVLKKHSPAYAARLHIDFYRSIAGY